MDNAKQMLMLNSLKPHLIVQNNTDLKSGVKNDEFLPPDPPKNFIIQ